MTVPRAAIELTRAGLVLGKEQVPLLSGSVHYWRLPRHVWRPALEELRSLGARFVDTYVPWGVHEVAPGEHDYGEREPRNDVVAFLRTAEAVGLYAIVRPGPHINSELTFFGIPERVIWNDACQARSATNRRVILPFLPLSFPVPSYASRAFFDEASRWLQSVARRLSPLVFPHGPITLVQVDNEGALFFRDGVYDQDYHPDSIGQYRRFLRGKYKKLNVLRGAYEDDDIGFDTIEPPARLDADHADRLARHLDWAEFQESIIETALYRFQRVLRENGLSQVPMFHNLPQAESATPIDPARVGRVLDFIAIDYYHHAKPQIVGEIARRTTEVAVRARLANAPAFAAEMGAGFAPYFPPLEESDNAFCALTALAFGLRGMNLYMAVGRDRWIGAPIDPRGRSRPSADFWQRLFGALERMDFASLERRTPVSLVVPRALKRLTRVCHAFGPLSPAAFAVTGEQAERGCLEDDFGLSGPVAIEAEQFVRRLERHLDGLRIPYALLSDDLIDHALTHSEWVVVASAGGMARPLVERLAQAIMGSHAVSVGPRLPERSETFRPQAARLPEPDNARAQVALPLDDAALRRAVARVAVDLNLFRLDADPASIVATVHHDQRGLPRALFVINPTPTAVTARVGTGGATTATDALSLESVAVIDGHAELRVTGRSVRLLELGPIS